MSVQAHASKIHITDIRVP